MNVYGFESIFFLNEIKTYHMVHEHKLCFNLYLLYLIVCGFNKIEEFVVRN